MLKYKIERHTTYKKDGKSVDFVESTDFNGLPVRRDLPISMSIFCTISDQINRYRMNIVLQKYFDKQNKSCKFHITWKDPEIKIPRAVFLVQPGKINVEISKIGYSYEDLNCFYACIFFGTDSQILKNLNNTTLVSLVDLLVINSNDVWFYDSCFDSKSICFMPTGIEKDSWWEFYRVSNEIMSISDFCMSPDRSVYEIKNMFENYPNFDTHISLLFMFIELMLSDLPATELFKCGLRVYKDVHEKEGFVVDGITGRIYYKGIENKMKNTYVSLDDFKTKK